MVLVQNGRRRRFAARWCSAAFLFWAFFTPGQAQEGVDHITRDVASDLNRPWEVVWGPDEYLWFTERPGRISRVQPETRDRSVILDISDRVSLTHEGGMMGMALDPDFDNRPFVYVAYSQYSELKQRDALYVTRWRYDAEANVLRDEEELLPPSSTWNIHLGCRLLVGPQRTLFISIGDTGDQTRPLDPGQMQGKIHRINLDGSIPADNPDPASSVWSIGHRNPQGLAFGREGQLYSSEHGTDDDDEFNIIVKGGNFGWPRVIGPCDNVLEEAYCDEFNVVEPIYSWTPTIAPSGIEFYDHDLFPEWRNSVLISTLKNQRIYRMEMSPDGNQVVAEHQLFKGIWGRLRDFAISPEGRLFISATNLERDLPFPDRVFEVLPVSASTLEQPVDKLTFAGAELVESATKQIVLRNQGDEPLIIYDVFIDGPDAAAFVVGAADRRLTLDGKQEKAVAVEYAPLQGVEHNAVLHFSSNQAGGASWQVELIGRVNGPGVVVRRAYLHSDNLIDDSDVVVRIPLEERLTGVLNTELEENPVFNLKAASIAGANILVRLGRSDSDDPVLADLRIQVDGRDIESLQLAANVSRLLWTDETGRLLRDVDQLIRLNVKREFNRLLPVFLVNLEKAERRVISYYFEAEQAPELELLQGTPILPPRINTELDLELRALRAGGVDTQLGLVTDDGQLIERDVRVNVLDWTPTSADEVHFTSAAFPALVDTVVFVPGSVGGQAAEAHARLEGSEFVSIQFVDGSLAAGDTLWIGLRAELSDNAYRTADLIIEYEKALMRTVRLFANENPSSVGEAPAEISLRVQPNPVRDVLILAAELPRAGEWSLRVFDQAGRLVMQQAGRSAAPALQLNVDLRSALSKMPPAGMYVAELRSGGRTLSTSFILLN